jgi:hypothetical protein
MRVLPTNFCRAFLRNGKAAFTAEKQQTAKVKISKTVEDFPFGGIINIQN